MVDLKGKVVLITGASSGFGEDAARLFAREGCRVILAARRVDRLQALNEKIEADGGESIVIPVDVTNRHEIDLMVRSALDLYGAIDILFNNAGFGRLNWLENLDPGRDIELQVQANLLGVIQVTRAVLPHMLARGSGHIINMSSVAGLIAAPLYSVYAATKFGVRAFSDALRREVAPFRIRVSTIFPGPARTEFGLHTGAASAIRRRLNVFARLSLRSEYVARRVVGLAKRPRRSLVIPGWYAVLAALAHMFPGLTDWFVGQLFVKRFHTSRQD